MSTARGAETLAVAPRDLRPVSREPTRVHTGCDGSDEPVWVHTGCDGRDEPVRVHTGCDGCDEPVWVGFRWTRRGRSRHRFKCAGCSDD